MILQALVKLLFDKYHLEQLPSSCKSLILQDLTRFTYTLLQD